MRIVYTAVLTLLLALAASGATVIRADRIIDGNGHVFASSAVIVDGGKITGIDPHPSHVDYDLKGMTLMPGGIDTHVHIAWHFDADGRSHDDETDRNESPEQSVLYAAENAYRTLIGGVTTVQSLGAPVDKPLRDAIERGVLPGCRILTAIDPISDETLTAEQLREAVRKLAAEKADVVKVFASKSIRNGGGPTMSQEQMNAICDEARKHGLRVAVHAHGPESVRRAVLAGATSIEHGVLIGQPELDLMAGHGTYFDPQLDLVFRNYFENESHFIGIGNYTTEGFAQMHAAVPKALDVFKKALATKNLKVIFGTDAVAGSHGRNFQELVYRVEKGGQNPMDALTSATSLAAASLGMADRIGTIAPGFIADLIAVRGNPLTDIHALEHVEVVMKNGRVDYAAWKK